jgi:hypothetical protein
LFKINSIKKNNIYFEIIFYIFFSNYKLKKLVEFANKATVAHQIEALAKVGVTDIVLAVGF